MLYIAVQSVHCTVQCEAITQQSSIKVYPVSLTAVCKVYQVYKIIINYFIISLLPYTVQYSFVECSVHSTLKSVQYIFFSHLRNTVFT